MTTDFPIRLERLEGHVARITLERPQARNAIDDAMTLRLDALVAETEEDPEVRAVVFTGAGDEAFCAGADLKVIAAGRGASLRTARGGFAGLVAAPHAKPWIAAVNGAALAGGAEIALACDVILAAEHARLGLPEVQRGLIAGAGGLHRLVRALPRSLALELVMTGDPLTAAEAARRGLVNRLVPAADLQEAALQLARRIARNAPLAVRESLAIARQAFDLDEAALHLLAGSALKRVAASADLREGVQAFIEKREPRWTGA